MRFSVKITRNVLIQEIQFFHFLKPFKKVIEKIDNENKINP